MSTAERIDPRHSSTSSLPDAPRANMLDRLPPQNLDAEKSVLGCLLLNPMLCDDVLMILKAEDFYSDANGRLYAQMTAMHGEGLKIDATLLIERLRTSGELETIGGLAYLGEVAQSVAVPAHAEYYAEIVRNKSTLRHLIHAGTEIIRDAYDSSSDPVELLGRAEQKIFGINDMRSGGRVAEIHDVLLETFELIDRRVEHGGATGVPTGLHDLDNLTGGLHAGEFVVLAARPSMGKTALALNITENVVIDANVPTLFISLEMARHELAQRLLSSQGRIDGTKFRSGMMSKDDREKLVEASAKISKAPLFIDDSPSRSMSEIAAEARRIKRKYDLGLVVIDYLQLVSPENSKDPRQEQVAKIARRLKGLARELSLPVLCLAQLNRQVEAGAGKESHRPRMSHLRESGAIEQDADVVMFIHREEYYHTKEDAERDGITGQGDLIVAKQRNGPTGDVKLAWLHRFTRFENLAHQSHGEFDQYDGGDADVF